VLIEEDPSNSIVTNLEIAIYNYAIKEAGNRKILKKWENPYFIQLYIDRFRSIFLNLKNGDNQENSLIHQLKTGEITSQSLAFMTHQEMNPVQWKKRIEQKVKRDANKFNKKVQASTDMFTCKKCRSKECTYYELQTRSADEPATIFVTCLSCGKNWKS
jgi:transcription elongation factor S-II